MKMFKDFEKSTEINAYSKIYDLYQAKRYLDSYTQNLPSFFSELGNFDFIFWYKNFFDFSTKGKQTILIRIEVTPRLRAQTKATTPAGRTEKKTWVPKDLLVPRKKSSY